MPHVLPYSAEAETEDTRRIAETLAAILSGTADGPDLFAGARIWVQGDYWWSGDIDPTKAATIQAKFHQCLIGGYAGLTSKVLSIIADGNKAAIEMVLSGVWHDGRDFSKEIHIAIDVEEGRIVSYREYGFDTAFFALEKED